LAFGSISLFMGLKNLHEQNDSDTVRKMETKQEIKTISHVSEFLLRF
jgi:hypothetical protein